MKDYIRYCIQVIFLSVLINAYATKIVVQQGGTLSSITAAISQANPGDTVLVKSGTYREGNILITKSIVLLGEGLPVVDGEHKVEVFSVEADNVTIEGFRITNSGISSIKDLAGIGMVGGNHLVVRNNVLVGNFFGVHLSNAAHAIIEGNILRASLRADHQTGNGIHLWQCTQATIRNNVVNGHRDGIYFEFVTNSTISGNTSEANHRYGLHFMFSHDDEYRNNIFRNNGAGVAVMYTRHVTMVNNIFDRNWGPTAYGLLLKDIRDSHIIGNRFDRNTIAIYMEGSSRSTFKQNTFVGNGWAVKLQASCDDNTFTENNFTSNTFDLATNGTMVLNKIDRNYWDKYQGYDLNKDGIGDVPFRPVNMYAMVVERIPTAVLLWRSFLVFLMDRAEKVFPAVTPENLKDDYPSMKPYDLS